MTIGGDIARRSSPISSLSRILHLHIIPCAAKGTRSTMGDAVICRMSIFLASKFTYITVFFVEGTHWPIVLVCCRKKCEKKHGEMRIYHHTIGCTFTIEVVSHFSPYRIFLTAGSLALVRRISTVAPQATTATNIAVKLMHVIRNLLTNRKAL